MQTFDEKILKFLRDGDATLLSELETDAESQPVIAVKILENTEGYQLSAGEGCSVQLLKLLGIVTRSLDDLDASEAHYRRAVIHRQIGDSDNAVSETMLALSRADHEIAFEVVSTFRDSSELEALRRHLPKLLDVAEKAKNRCPHFYITISDALIGLGDYADSQIHLSRARDLNCHREVKLETLATVGGEGVLPSVIITGAMKCGTTMLFESLMSHPQVGRTARKEINYFENAHANWEWYLSHFIRKELGNGKISIDASATYYCKDVVGRVQDQLPNSKFVMLVRDPARRAISHYFHIARHGVIQVSIGEFFNLDYFQQLLAKSDNEIEATLLDISTGRRPGNVAIAFGFYYYYLQRWMRAFDRDRFLFISLQDLHEMPRETLERVCSFAGVDHELELHLADPYAGIYRKDTEEVEDVFRNLSTLYTDSRKRFEDAFQMKIGNL